MAFNGSGTFNRNTGVYTGSTAWTQTRDAARKVRADDHDTHDQDIANGLSNCVTKDGQTTITANLPMAGFRHTNCGNAVSDTDYTTLGQIKSGVTFNSSAKIKGDFSNATVESRTAFQTSTTNGNTLLEVIPDGTATTAQITLNGASDPANTATLQVQNVGTEVRLNASKRGTGSYTPMVFYTSDLERMRIATDGRVALGGPATVRAQFHVLGAGQTTAALTDAGNRGGTLRVIDANGSAGNGGAITFGTSTADTADSVGFAAIKGLLTNGATNTTGDLAISTRNAIADTALTERIRIMAAGQVGIGTSAPANQLHVHTSAVGGDTSLQITNNSSGITSADGFTILMQNGLDCYMSLRENANLFFRTNDTDRLVCTSAGNTRPGADNTYTIGQSGTRWSAVWAANGTIQTSDQREKTDIADAALGLNFIKALRPVSYKWVNGGNTVSKNENGETVLTPQPGSRTHWGLLAQEVKAAVDAAGIDFGGWLLTDKNDPDSQQALRYDQFIAPLIQAVKELLARVEALEAGNP